MMGVRRRGSVTSYGINLPPSGSSVAAAVTGKNGVNVDEDLKTGKTSVRIQDNI